MLKSYKYLGVHMNNKLDWKDNTKTFDKKKDTPKALSLLSSKSAGSTAVDLILTVVTSAIFHGVVCWGSSISAADRKRGQLCVLEGRLDQWTA